MKLLKSNKINLFHEKIIIKELVHNNKLIFNLI
jgi:hypothetical protein